MTTDRTPAEPKRDRVSLHESKPHYFTDEDGVSHEGPPRCSGCDMRWPCDAFLLNKQPDGLVDLSSAALAHDQRVAETAVEAYRASLREGIRDRIVEVEADAKLPVKDRRMGTDFRRGGPGSFQAAARLLRARSWSPDCGAPPEAPCDPKCSQPDRVSVPQKERRG